MSIEPIAELQSIAIEEPEAPTIYQLGKLLETFEADAVKRHRARLTGELNGPAIPFPRVAREFAGGMPDGLHIILGGPGAGKTAYGLQSACQCECPAIYISCEMSPLELLRRITARETKTFLGRFKTGELAPETALELARQAATSCPQLCIVDANSHFASPAWISRIARVVKGDSPHVLIVVDSLQSWSEGAGADAGEYETISAACHSLRALAAQLSCPIIALCERNRASFGKNASKDKLGSGAGSRKIEYSAESVISLEAAEDGMGLSDHETAVRLTLAKNRHGMKGATVDLVFHGALQSFREAS
jgi:replicative DNA helicase